jgi:cyanobactin maturation PatA/PatG family protease
METRSVLDDLHLPDDEILGDPQVCIAVLDGPVDMTHPCFAGADLTRLDTLVQEPAGQGPMSLHGTHVASVLFGQPGSPVVGMAPRCRGLILPVFHDYEEGRVSQLDLARAIERAVQEGAHVINISGGERSAHGQPDPILAQALRRCDESGVLVVAAVGNDGCEGLQIPAAIPSVLAVGASDASGQPLASNNWSANEDRHVVLAPGHHIDGAAPGGGRRALTGSSFATPVVAGLAALLLADQLRSGQAAKPVEVGHAILNAASPCHLSGATEDAEHLACNLNVARTYHSITRGRKPAVSSVDTVLLPQTAQQTKPREPYTGAGAAAMNAAAEGEPAASSDTAPAGDGVVAAGEPACAITTNDVMEPAAMQHVPGASGPIVPAAASTPHTSASTTAHASGAHQTSSAHRPMHTDEGVRPASGCGCGSQEQGSLVFAIGTIGIDFRTEARRDSIQQLMDSVPGPEVEVPGTQPGGPDRFPSTLPANPYDPKQLSAYLKRNPWDSDKVTWTLLMERTPLYALEAETPVGMTWGDDILPLGWDRSKTNVDQLAGMFDSMSSIPPVSQVYRTFRDAIAGQVLPHDNDHYVSRVSIPGVLTNRTVRLFSGQIVPVVKVSSRGIYTWNEAALVNHAVDAVLRDQRTTDKSGMNETTLQQTVRALLDKVYYQFRNLGQAPGDRALNYAGTNAFQLTSTIAEGLLSGSYVPGGSENFYTLDTITVAKSPYDRIDSDCWDVSVNFIDPENLLRANVIYLFTIDVSDELPVSLAPAHRFLAGR